MAGGFLSNFLPFGSSNQSNPTPQATPANASTVGGPGAQQQPQQYVPGTQQLAQPANANHQPAPAANSGAPGEGNSGAPIDPAKGAQPGSSMDQFTGIFKLPESTPANADPMGQPLLQMDPAKLQEAVKKMDFSRAIDPEQAQKAMQGDMQAFMSVLNGVAQNAVLAGMASNAQVVETAVRKNNERYDSVLPDRVRNLQVSQAQLKNPAFSHPAAAPMVSAMKMQIAAANPQMTPDQVATQAERYFETFATDLQSQNPANVQQQKQQQNSGPDWSSFIAG